MPRLYPRFHPGPSAGRLDSFSERGARELARRIRTAWANIGWDVEVRVERIASEELGDGRSVAHFTVRSDLVNGLPQRRLEQAVRALPRAA
ncbi:hypothetical protein J2848_001447 [Azospirillum lipoferum]|uniref:Uncharacterized protein n=1 Tax=Azospirillum lipoferum TaxID=193 RepID=A0A5A9GV24_AZOLI|nr:MULTISPECIES: hypothetical protein [Azospirillum]KAA0598220.1 hypothetical protein FZ942_03800 [Azospirillum lipoferum]MCP1609800.1 hypothetical protein [Azospirillum lipoferum]MDW5534896.1 hypothetical protein [Azospirillum sp. NL1]